MGSQPKAPDPYQQAAAQQSSDLYGGAANAIINNPNQQSPYGSVNYTNAGYETLYNAQGQPTYVPRYTRTVSLSPDQQRLQGLQTQSQYNMGQTAVEQSSRLRSLLGTPFSTAGMQGWATPQAPAMSGPTDRAAVENAMMSRFNTDQATQTAQQNAQMAARGMNPGSMGYDQLQMARDRARTDALNQAYLVSGQEARANALQNYNLSSSYASALDNLRQSQLRESLGLRELPINETSALLSGSQVTLPQFQQFAGANIPAAPVGQYIGNDYQAALNQAQQGNAGLFNLGTGLMGGIGQAGGIGKYFSPFAFAAGA